MKKPFIAGMLLATILIGAAATLTAFNFGSRGKEYEAAHATRGSVAGIIEETGDISSNDEYTYYAAISAPISSISIKKGDSVSIGDKLVTYDTKDYEHNVIQAELQSKQSEDTANGQISKSNNYSAKYNQAVADDQAYAVLYYISRENGDSITETRYSTNYQMQCEIDGLNRQIAEVSEEIVNLQSEMTKISNSDNPDPNLINEKENAIADKNNRVAELRSTLASIYPQSYTPTENMQINDISNQMEDISRNWTQARTNINAYEANVLTAGQKEALNDQVDIAKENESYARSSLEKAQAGIDATFDGIVTSCSVEEGSVVAKGSPLFTIVSRSDLKVTVMLSKYDVASVREGQRAELDVAGKRYVGHVSRISQIATTDSSDKSKVEVDIKIEGGQDLILGIEADVTIYTDEKDDVLLIPYAAFYSDDEGDYCYVIEDGVIVKKYIQAGIVSNDSVEVRDGLKENAVVITDAITDEQVGDKAVEAVH
ncbi:MAG: HlyD family efflux transporter periplasmic adaptor subunit [Lachnospiraceae bacterium]|nr:HlyD family efflux transporter periplasmic adaptor subunit [Lachnospiraceae bacterium]